MIKWSMENTQKYRSILIELVYTTTSNAAYTLNLGYRSCHGGWSCLCTVSWLMLAQLDLHGFAQPHSQLVYLEPLEKWRRCNNCYKLSRTAHGQKWRTITTPRAMRQREHNCPSEWVQEFSTPDLQQNTAATISIEKLNVLWARAFALLQG